MFQFGSTRNKDSVILSPKIGKQDKRPSFELASPSHLRKLNKRPGANSSVYSISRFIWIQTYKLFYFSRRLFAKHHNLSSWGRIFSSKSRSRKIRILSISKFFVYCCHSDIDFTKNYI